ncbi:MAG: hypothetical protein WA211_07195 [Candidatus Acidiferrales bacterium]
MNEICSLDDFLQSLDARLRRFQALRFGNPNKIAVGEPLEYVEHDDLVPPAVKPSIFNAKLRQPLSLAKSVIYGRHEKNLHPSPCNFANPSEHAA